MNSWTIQTQKYAEINRHPLRLITAYNTYLKSRLTYRSRNICCFIFCDLLIVCWVSSFKQQNLLHSIAFSCLNCCWNSQSLSCYASSSFCLIVKDLLSSYLGTLKAIRPVRKEVWLARATYWSDFKPVRNFMTFICFLYKYILKLTLTNLFTFY